MEADVSVAEDEVSFDPQDLLGDPARQEISQTSLEIMQLLAECEGGHELFGNIHQGNFIYDNASLVGSSSELSDIFQDDNHANTISGHRLDDILVNSIESLNKSPTKSSNCHGDPTAQKKTRKSKNVNKNTAKSSKPKKWSSRRKKSSIIDTDENPKSRPRVKLPKSPGNGKLGDKLPIGGVRNCSNLSDSTTSSRFEINSKYEIGKDGTYTCNVCGKKFSTVRFLQIHSTVHRQKVKFVRNSSTPSKKDSNLPRSKRSSSLLSIKNTSLIEKGARKGLVYSCVTKGHDLISDINSVAGSDGHMTDRSKNGKSAEISQEGGLNRREGDALDARYFDNSGIRDLTDFSDRRKKNARCSEILRSLSKQGTEEYMTLSSRKSKTSDKNKTADNLKRSGDTETIANLTVGKPNRNVSKTQKKSVISTGQSSVSGIKSKRKRKASGTFGGEKYPMKRIRLLDRFWDDDEQSSNSDSLYLSTVDLNPKTNGGLLQSFEVGKSQESLKSRRMKGRIEQGKFIRTKKVKTSEQKTAETKQIISGNVESLVGNTPVRETVVLQSFGSEIFPSTDNSSNACVRSNCKKEIVKHCSKKTQELQSTDPNFLKHSDLNLTLNVKSRQTICPTAQKYQPGSIPNGEERFDGITQGTERDSTFHQNPEEKSKMNSVVLPQQDIDTIQKTKRRGDNSVGESHIGSLFVQNNIPQTLISKYDVLVDSNSDNGQEAEMSFFENGEMGEKPTLCNNDGLRINDGVNESTSRESCCEPIIYESEGYYDCGDNQSDFSNSDTSDDESEPLVLYKQSCRTLPLCALLKLARCQKLEHDLARKKYDLQQENTLKTSGLPVFVKGAQLSDTQVDIQMKHSDENNASEKIERFGLPRQVVEDSPLKTRLKSSKDIDVGSTEISEDHFNANLLDRNGVEIESVTEYQRIDRQGSLCGSDSTTLSSKPAKSVSSSHSDLLPVEPAKPVSGSQSSPLTAEPVKPVSGSQSSPLTAEPVKPVSGSQSSPLTAETVKPVSGSQSSPLTAEPVKPVSGSQSSPLTAEPACFVSVLESTSFSDEPPKSEKSSRLCDSVHQEKIVFLSTDGVKSDLPFKKLATTLCDMEQDASSSEKQLKPNPKSLGDGLTQESDTNQSNLIPMTEGPLHDGLSSSVIKCDEDTFRVSKLMANSDFQKSPKLSTLTDIMICSLKSIADDNCIEISRSVLQQSSMSVGGETPVKTATQEMSEEDEDHRMLKKNTPHQNVESNEIVDDMPDDKSHIRNSVMSTYTNNDKSVCLSKEVKLGFKYTGIEVPDKLPKNLMSTCNVVGSFVDDMVTGITNVIDTETNSSDSCSVFSKYHDYCARQISYQNFLERKLQESVDKECSKDKDKCVRLLADQDFQRTKCHDLLSRKHLEEITQMGSTTNFQEADSQNTEMKMTRTHHNTDKRVITQTDKVVNWNREQLAVRQADDTGTVTRNFEQPNLRQVDNAVTVLNGRTKDLKVNVAIRSEAVLTDKSESSEDECDIPFNNNQVDNCARVLPFETNIMHKFSNKTKLLFQEYHSRQQISQDNSYFDTDGKRSELNLAVDNHTQTVSSIEENECSVYEIHSLGNSNSNENQNILKVNTGSNGSHSSFSEISSEEAWSTESLKSTQSFTSVNSRGFDVSASLSSNLSELKSKSDSLPFKSSMNVFNLEDISTAVLNQQNIPLSKQEQRYLKSPKKLWYRNYMGGISTMEEKGGDNSKNDMDGISTMEEKGGDNLKTFETSSDQKSFVFPDLCDSEQHDNAEVELSTGLESIFGKENAPSKKFIADSEECLHPDEYSRQSCDDVVRNIDESQNNNINTLSDTDHFSDTSVRLGICSRIQQFRKRKSCARACRDGYLRGCARSRVFVRKTNR